MQPPALPASATLLPPCTEALGYSEQTVTVTTEEVTHWELRVRIHPLGSWCRVQFEESSGLVVIISDHGTWSWSSPPRYRSSTLPAFLAKCDLYYLASKFLGPDCTEFDADLTREAVRGRILDARRDEEMTKEEARAEWDSTDFESEAEWAYFTGHTSISDAWEYAETQVASSWRHFWERLWLPHVRPQLLVLAEQQAT